MKNSTDWSKLQLSDVNLFAEGFLSGNQLYSKYKNTEVGGTVRTLLRERGVDKARELARRAIRRATSNGKIGRN